MSTTLNFDDLRRAFAALETAAIRHRDHVRREMRVGEVELSALLYLDRRGAMLQGELTGSTGLSSTGVSVMLHRLEERGFVERRTDPEDRSRRFVELSIEGRARLEHAYGDFTDAVDRLKSEGDSNQVASLVRLLDGLLTVGTAHDGADGAS